MPIQRWASLLRAEIISCRGYYASRRSGVVLLLCKIVTLGDWFTADLDWHGCSVSMLMCRASFPVDSCVKQLWFCSEWFYLNECVFFLACKKKESERSSKIVKAIKTVQSGVIADPSDSSLVSSVTQICSFSAVGTTESEKERDRDGGWGIGLAFISRVRGWDKQWSSGSEHLAPAEGLGCYSSSFWKKWCLWFALCSILGTMPALLQVQSWQKSSLYSASGLDLLGVDMDLAFGLRPYYFCCWRCVFVLVCVHAFQEIETGSEVKDHFVSVIVYIKGAVSDFGGSSSLPLLLLMIVLNWPGREPTASGLFETDANH